MSNVNNINHFIPLTSERKTIPVSKPRNAEDRKLMDTCQQFEALFYYQMLKEMRKTVPKDGFIPENNEQSIYSSMLDEEVAKLIAKSNASIAQVLYEQLRDKSKEQKLEEDSNNANGKTPF